LRSESHDNLAGNRIVSGRRDQDRLDRADQVWRRLEVHCLQTGRPAAELTREAAGLFPAAQLETQLS
jgi:hypothetical protein